MDTSIIKSLYEQIEQAMNALRQSVREQVGETPTLDGVTPISNKIRAVSVSSSAIFNSPGFILAPSYYIQETQNEAVCDYLLKDGLTLDQMVSRLNEIVESKKVVYKGETVRLNPNTLATLQKVQVNLA